MSKKTCVLLSLLVLTPALFAVDEIAREEKDAAARMLGSDYACAVSKMVFLGALCGYFKDPRSSAEVNAPYNSYKELEEITHRVAYQTRIISIEEAKGKTRQNVQAIKNAKDRKQEAENIKAKLEQTNDEFAKKMPDVVALLPELRIKEAKATVACADLTDFDAKTVLHDRQVELKEAEELEAAAQRDVVCAQKAVVGAENAVKGKATKAEQEKIKEAYVRLGAAQKKCKDANENVELLRDSFRKAMLRVKGDEYLNVLTATSRKNEAVHELERHKNDPDRKKYEEDVVKAEKNLAAAQQEYDKLVADPLRDLGTEKALAKARATLARLIKDQPQKGWWDSVKSSSLWRTFIQTGYAPNQFTKDALAYNAAGDTATVAEKLTAVKKALTKQGLDFAASVRKTVLPSFGLGAIATAACAGAAYKFLNGRVLGNRLYEAAAVGGCSGLLTTLAAGLSLGYRHGLFSYSERRAHILDTAKRDKIDNKLALRAYADITGADHAKAVKKFGPMGLWEMKSLVNQMN